MLGNISDNINFHKKALDGTAERHKAISSNIANINTPKYKRKYVSFEDQLKSEMNKTKETGLRTTHKNHIGGNDSSFKPHLLTDSSNSYRIDGNNTNIDIESTDLAKNSIMYNALVKQISSEFEKIKNVVREGSK